ncbi:MAG TPA: EAL domain-containing protein, partial [Acidimicrobiales bacterium]|nr:EAL domain-containing protein [Acidimicrobiales bacterium]
GIAWPALAGALALAEAACPVLALGEGRLRLSLAGAVLALGLATCAPAWLVPAAAAGTALGRLAGGTRHPGRLARSAGASALGAALAGLAYHAVLSGAPPPSVRGLAATVAGVAAFEAVRWAGTPPVGAAATALAGGTLALVGAASGWVAAVAAWRQPWAPVALAAPLATGTAVLARTARRLAELEAVDRFVQELAAPAESVAAAVAGATRRALRADRAELAIFTAAGRVRRSVAAGEGAVSSVLVPRSSCRLEALAAGRGRALVLSRQERQGPASDLLAERRLQEAVVAPLRDAEAVMGTLMAARGRPGPEGFGRSSARLLERLAAQASVALRSEALAAQLRQELAERHYRSLHDELTGLPNRTAFAQRLDQAIASGEDGLCVMLVDIDRFKEVNDTLGHHSGDAILVEAASRLAAAVGSGGTVARLSADEFAALVAGVRGPESARALAEQVASAVAVPFHLEELTFELGASIGIALHPQHGDDATTLLQRADVAVHASKSAHGQPVVYGPEHDHYTPRRLALVGELRQAIEEGGLAVHYQPIAEVGSGRVVAVEALARWPHPHHGHLAPDEFIPIAEQTGLIRPLTAAVLRTALVQLAAWRRRGLDLGVSVNLSVASLSDPDLVEQVMAELARAGLAASHLTLEITESGIMADLERAGACLGQLSAEGVGLAVDDFGTGHSSLSYLRRLPVDEVKIDKSFILHMGSHPSDAVIVA